MNHDTEAALVARIRHTPPLLDPSAAEAKLADLLARAPAPLAEALASGPLRDLLLALADHSAFLWRLCLADPDRLGDLVTRPPEEGAAALVAAQRAVGADFAAGTIGREEAMRRLRLNRGGLALLVALADIGGAWGVEAVTAALSDFADASVSSAAAIAVQEMFAAGKLSSPDPGQGFVVLALGKHGGRELNYSSDVDLVVFYDPEAGLAPAGASTVYTRVAQSIAKLLQERTADGYAHRVDYRLRPDPASTPAALSTPAAYTYYETVGQNWERAAMIKARPVAGDLELGRRFLADLSPFIWRKYFDFASIADIHAMKRQIHAVRGHDEVAVAGHDIKLGRGGIREIEFFVQTQQLVFGGRRPSLRGRQTVPMLAALHDEGWISAAARDELAQAYSFLRTIEHRLQMVADEQTQRLPSDPDALARFAAFAGYPSLAAFESALTDEARRVQGHYALLFEEGPELASEAGNLVFVGTTDDPETLTTLRRLGFQRPELAAETVRGWHFGRRPAITTPRAREVLTELVPRLLAALGGTADPDGALAHLDRAFGRMPAVVELLTILGSHEKLLLLFADLLGTAPRLADTVAQTPHVLDAIIDPAFAGPIQGEAEIDAGVRALIGRPAGFEEFLDAVRGAARQMRFVLGAKLLSDIVSPAQGGEAQAALAGAVIQVSLERVREAFAEEHGTVPGGRIAVLGLGRLGSRDLTAGSDLDLVVLYDYDPEDRTSSGRRPLDAVVYHTRLAQRLIGALTVPTRRGRLYEVDLRLRPQGGKGPIAPQYRGFVAYQTGEAELWEHMALTRARAVAGDPSLRSQAEEAVRTVLTRPRDPAAVYREVAAMRALIAREKGEGDVYDLKLAAGGLTDLDFLAQALVLAHAARHKELVGRPTPAVIEAAGSLGLLDAGDARTCAEAYTALNDLHHWQRLTIEGRFDPATVPGPILKRLATVAGLPDPARLEAHLREVQGEVRRVFKAVLG